MNNGIILCTSKPSTFILTFENYYYNNSIGSIWTRKISSNPKNNLIFIKNQGSISHQETADYGL